MFNATYYKLKIIQWKHLKNAVSLKNPHHILKVSKSIFTIIKPHPENNTQRKKKNLPQFPLENISETKELNFSPYFSQHKPSTHEILHLGSTSAPLQIDEKFTIIAPSQLQHTTGFIAPRSVVCAHDRGCYKKIQY